MSARLHLWWNGYDHAPGATAEDAVRWLMARSGCPEEDCQGEGWDPIPDNALMRDDSGAGMGSMTASEYAAWLASRPERPTLRLVWSAPSGGPDAP